MNLNLTVPVATAVVCTTINCCAVNGAGNIRDKRNPMSADCKDILSTGKITKPEPKTRCIKCSELTC